MKNSKLKRLIYFKYLSSNVIPFIVTVLFPTITIYLLIIDGISLKLTIVFTGASIAMIAKSIYYWNERNKIFIKINTQQALEPILGNGYKIQKELGLNIVKRRNELGIKEKSFPPFFIDKNTIEKDDYILILKSKWNNWNVKENEYNFYYQIIYVGRNNTKELLSLKFLEHYKVYGVKEIKLESVSNFAILFAQKLSVKYKIVTNC